MSLRVPTIVATVALFALGLVAGGGVFTSVDAAPVVTIQKDMTRQQVIEQLGPPTFQADRDSLWIYDSLGVDDLPRLTPEGLRLKLHSPRATFPADRSYGQRSVGQYEGRLQLRFADKRLIGIEQRGFHANY